MPSQSPNIVDVQISAVTVTISVVFYITNKIYTQINHCLGIESDQLVVQKCLADKFSYLL